MISFVTLVELGPSLELQFCHESSDNVCMVKDVALTTLQFPTDLIYSFDDVCQVCQMTSKF